MTQAIYLKFITLINGLINKVHWWSNVRYFLVLNLVKIDECLTSIKFGTFSKIKDTFFVCTCNFSGISS